MRITGLLEIIDEAIPLQWAMKGDPVGLQVMAEDREVKRLGIAYELNEEIVAKASEQEIDLIVAFHPLIYPHLTSITGKNRVERTVISLIDRRIALYILHTAFDAHPRGTSRLLAEGLNCSDIHPLVADPEEPGQGMGAVGRLDEPLPLSELAAQLKEICQAPVIRVSTAQGSPSDPVISSVAILGGSGMSFYDQAVAAGADAFITADARYHAFHAANDGIPLLDPGHAESEAFVVEGMASLIEEALRKVGETITLVRFTESTNPVRYIV